MQRWAWVAVGLLATAAWGEERLWTEARGRRAHRERSAIAEVARAAMPAVVSISTRLQADPQQGIGSGFVIHPDGWIVTSSHVIEGATEIWIRLHGGADELRAEVRGLDESSDLALLRVHPGRRLPVVKLGASSAVEVADWVVVIGNPFGLGHTVTVGVVSFVGRTDVTPVGRTGGLDFLQTDAPINPGNSGGPMLNLRGDVVGVANAVNLAGQGIGFAIPVDRVKEVLPRLRRGTFARRPPAEPSALKLVSARAALPLGGSVSEVDEQSSRRAGLAAPFGALIREVITGGALDRAGLTPGDVVLKVNATEVATPEELLREVRRVRDGERITLFVRRNQQTRYFALRKP
jgi:serine protease Do